MSQAKRILVVDDEPGTVRVLAAVLEDAGCSVDSATDGRAALELLQTSSYDVVLLDYLMPQLDGCQTLAAIRKSKAFGSVRVVMMSGVAESMVRRRCRSGFDAFLYKPFSLAELLTVVLGPKRAAKRKPPKRRRASS